MAFEIPTALIRRLQAGLRQEAGVPSYDPNDLSIPSLPSIREAIAGLDPSLPSYLTCIKCRAGLLRGVHSTLCVFCGAEQRRDGGVLHTISFNSTAACRKLLESLDLDGSEVVTLDTEPNDTSKSRDAPKDGLPLSSLLDLELRWPLEKEAIDNSTVKKASSIISSSSINLTGVDLDSFFSDTKHETSSSAPSVTSEQLTSKAQTVKTESHVSSGAEDSLFFDNLQPSDVALSSTNTKSGDFDDSFADWEAEFQSANSESCAAESKSVNHVQDSTIVFANPTTTAATPGATSTSIDHVQGSPTVLSGAGVLAATFATDSKSVDLFQDSFSSEFISPTIVSETKSVDLFHGSTAEYAGPAVAADSSTDLFQDSSLTDEFTGQVTVNAKVNRHENVIHETSSKSKNEPTNDWGQFSSSGNWIEDDLWLNLNSEVPKTTDQFQDISKTNDDKPKNEEQNMTSESDSWVQHELWPTSSTNELQNTKNASKGDDLLDDWQDFTSSTEPQVASSNSWAQTSTKAMSYEHVSGAKSVDLQDMEFGDFFQSDSFSGSLGGQKDSSEVHDMQLNTAVSYRMNGPDAENRSGSIIPGTGEFNENCTLAPNLESSNVEMLLAKMPDLSFMLENDLSIPKNADSSGPNS